MRFSLLLPSSSLDAIRHNVVILHAFALVLGGLYMVGAILPHDEPAIRSQLGIASATVLFGVLNFIVARLQMRDLVSISLLIWFGLLSYRSFQVIDPTGSAMVVNMAFLTVVMLFSLYFRKTAGFVVLIAVLLMNIARWYFMQEGVIKPVVTENTGRFETLFLALLTIYTIILVGYYQIQVQRLIRHLELKKQRISGALEDLRYKQLHTKNLVKDINDFAEIQVPKIKNIVEKSEEKLEKTFPADYNTILGTGTEMATSVDFLLRNIDKHISQIGGKK